MNSDVIDRAAKTARPATARPGTTRQATERQAAERPATAGPSVTGRRPARPGRRPRPGAPAQLPKSPVRPASPVRSPGPGRPGKAARIDEVQRDQQPAGAGQPGQIGRTSFVLLLLGLLGGGLVCLLVVNTTLAAGSIEIRKLQQQNASITSRVQELQQQIAVERSAAQIEKEARRLGMRPDPSLVFINLRTKSIQQPSGAALAADQAAAKSAAEKAAAGTRAAKAHRGHGHQSSHRGGSGQ